MEKSYIPNIITFMRIIGSFCLWAAEPFSLRFYIIYTLCGVSDILDGILARRLKAVTDKGAMLDSLADLTFYSVSVIRLITLFVKTVLPIVWYLTGAVIFLRLISYLFAAIKYHRFASLHTYGNKLTGFVLFCVPYLIFSFDRTALCIAVCLVGAIASIEELLIHIKSPLYNADAKTLFKIANRKAEQ